MNPLQYPSEISSICSEILKTTTLYNLTPKAKPYNKEILEATSHFPKTSSLSWRIRAIAENNPCSCIQCETIHGNPKRTFCSTDCSKKYKEKHTSSEEEKEKAIIEQRFKDAEERFHGKEEGFDFIVCQICGFKGQDLANHIKQHGYNSKRYKEEFNVRSMKCQLLIDKVKGENNPGYQHGGKFSKWSKNFINGYDEEAHKEFNRNAKERMSSEESKKNSIFCREHYDSDEEYLAHQSKNLDFFVNKYGEEEGKKRFEAKTEKWLKTLSEKSEEEMNEINRKKISKANVSKAEIELISTLKNHFPNIESQTVLNDGWKRFVYDIKFEDKIIEYNGTYWHCDPRIYEDEYINHKVGKTAKQIWESDERKLNYANEKGFKTLVIWEEDWKENKFHEINKCISFLSSQPLGRTHSLLESLF